MLLLSLYHVTVSCCMLFPGLLSSGVPDVGSQGYLIADVIYHSRVGRLSCSNYSIRSYLFYPLCHNLNIKNSALVQTPKFQLYSSVISLNDSIILETIDLRPNDRRF